MSKNIQKNCHRISGYNTYSLYDPAKASASEIEDGTANCFSENDSPLHVYL